MATQLRQRQQQVRRRRRTAWAATAGTVAASLMAATSVDAFHIPTTNLRVKNTIGAIGVGKGRSIRLYYSDDDSNDGGKPATALVDYLDTKTDFGIDTKNIETLKAMLKDMKLKDATRLMASHPTLRLTRDAFVTIFDTIEARTSDIEEMKAMQKEQMERAMQTAQNGGASGAQMMVPPVSPSRREMIDMYNTLRDTNKLTMFGAYTSSHEFPVQGSKDVSPALLEDAAQIDMESLTPKQSWNNFLVAGSLASLAEASIAAASGVDINLVLGTSVGLFALDRIAFSGALFETAFRFVLPEYSKKILRHEAGHFLIAYLLGCPVEGCVLSTWGALQDPRFGAVIGNTVTAGTLFFDEQLSEQVTGSKPLTRESIDRYSIIAMAGIAAEALEFGKAEGGAGDEANLVQILVSSMPAGGGAAKWTPDSIRAQARWSALQAILMLRQYRPCYDALVDALERGGKLGECVYAIESAAIKANLKPHAPPLGYFEDDGTGYAKWTPASERKLQPVQEQTTETPQIQKLSDEETLAQLRKVAETRLQQIQQELNSLE